MKTRQCIPALFCLAFLMPGITHALQIQSGKNVIIDQPVMEDLYIAGGEVTVNAPVYGDLIAAGGKIWVNDTITGDVVVAGGELDFNGYVGDDLRSAGGQLRILKDVQGDLVLTGGQIHVERGVVIHGDVLVFGGKLMLLGDINGKLRSGAGEMTVNGSIAKGADIRAGQLILDGRIRGDVVMAAREVSMGEDALIDGNLRYWTKDGSQDFGAHVSGTATFDESLKKEIKGSKQWGFLPSLGGILWYVMAMTALLAVLMLLFPGWFANAAANVQGDPARNLGVGFLLLVATPIAGVLLIFTVIGLPVGILLLVLFGMVAALSSVFTAAVGANYVNRIRGYDWKPWQLILAALGILVALRILSFIPILGWLLQFLLVCMALGALYMAFRDWRSSLGSA